MPGLREKFPRVKWHNTPGQESFSKILNEELKARSTSLALLSVSDEQLCDLTAKGLVLPLDGVFSSHELDGYASASMELSTINGKLYSIPEIIDPECLIFRKSFTNRGRYKPPRNWSELETCTRKLKHQGRPHPLCIYGNEVKRHEFIWALLGSNGIKVLQKLEDIVQFRRQLVEAFEWAKMMNDSFGLIEQLDERHYGWFTDFTSRIREGEFDLGFSKPGLLAGLPAAVQKDIAIVPFPRGPSGQHALTLVRQRSWCIPHNVEKPEASIKLLRSMQAYPNLKWMCLEGKRHFYTNRKLWRDPIVLRQKPLYRLLPTLLANRDQFRLPSADSAYEIANCFYRSILSGRSANQWINEVTSIVSRQKGKEIQSKLVRKALDYIHGRLSKIPTADDVARYLGISFRHMNRLFQTELEQNCADYIRVMRMEKAKVLLSDSSLSIKQVADRIGIGNPKSFANIFKNYWGYSPQSFRSEIFR